LEELGVRQEAQEDVSFGDQIKKQTKKYLTYRVSEYWGLPGQEIKN
jgi:hypothetical protein